jgi:hypothetical protein
MDFLWELRGGPLVGDPIASVGKLTQLWELHRRYCCLQPPHHAVVSCVATINDKSSVGPP